MQVAFVYDSEILHKSLRKCLQGNMTGGDQRILSYCEDIDRMLHEESDNGYKFYVVPRCVVYEEDILAKNARILGTTYVIKWCTV